MLYKLHFNSLSLSASAIQKLYFKIQYEFGQIEKKENHFR